MSQASARPTARTTGLVVKTVADEVLVYDLATHRTHALDPLAAMLWQACDGQRSVPALAAQLHVPVIAVEHGLGRLGQAGLLVERPDSWPTRREALRAGAGVLPVILSIVAPTPADAQSTTPPQVICVGSETPCTSDAQCCGGDCAPPQTCFCSPQPGPLPALCSLSLTQRRRRR